MSDRAKTFAEITDFWRDVHEALNRRDLPALDRVYLEGMEDVLDWMMANTCPNGDTRTKERPEFSSGYGWTLMLLPKMAAQDAQDENGAIFWTPAAPSTVGSGDSVGEAHDPQGASGPQA